MVLVAAALAAFVQTVPPPQKTTQDQVVRVRGCIQGTTLLLTEDPGFEVPKRKIRLDASRQVMRTVKEHNGHLEEVVAVLKSRRAATAYKEKRDKKTRVYVGVSEGMSTPTEEIVTAAPFLQVRDLTHLAPKCQIDR